VVLGGCEQYRRVCILYSPGEDRRAYNDCSPPHIHRPQWAHTKQAIQGLPALRQMILFTGFSLSLASFLPIVLCMVVPLTPSPPHLSSLFLFLIPIYRVTSESLCDSQKDGNAANSVNITEIFQ
jgi:hypothetical protein